MLLNVMVSVLNFITIVVLFIDDCKRDIVFVIESYSIGDSNPDGIVLYCIMRPYTDGPIGPLSYRHSSGVVRNPHSTLAE